MLAEDWERSSSSVHSAGFFSNEAGMGSAPNAAATAHVSHPAKQGFIQTLGVFFDTFIVCTSTAFIILLYSVTPKGDGIQVTQAALSHHIGGWAPGFIAPQCSCLPLVQLSETIIMVRQTLNLLKQAKHG